MDIGSVGSPSSVNVSGQQQVKVLNNQREQLKAVVGTLLEGVEAAPRPPEASGKGQKINVSA